MASLAIWWRAVRPYSFTASFTPVLVGSASALQGASFPAHLASFHPDRFLAALVGAVAIHAGTNLVNDYYDHVRGVDAPTSIGPSGVIQQGLLSARAVLGGGLALFALGGALGLWLVTVVGWPILVVGVASVAAGYAYTGGPLPLGYVGLGDLVVFLFMGPVIVLGAHYTQTGMLSASAVWASLSVGALVTAILVVNNLRDLQGDRTGGKRTLATLLGVSGTRAEYATLIASAYLAIIAGAALGRLPLLALIALLSLPRALAVWRVVRSETDPLALTRGGLRGTANLHLRVGIVLAWAFLFPLR
jgi:1,4-dihydroxy-2-naphthoate octaprenyltransferase